MILTYIDEKGTSYDLPRLSKSINGIIREIDLNITKGNEDGAYTKMLELARKCFGDEVTKELFGSLKYDDNLYLTELNVACVKIAKAYRKPVEDEKMDNDSIEKVTKLLESVGNVDKLKAIK